MEQVNQVNAHTVVEPLAGKRILLTGGTTGIGRAVAALLSAYGAKIFTFGRTPEHLQEALDEIRQAGGQAEGIVADQSKPEDVQRIFEQADAVLGGLDILINNAAVPAQNIKDMEEDQWRYAMETNLLGYMACTKEAISRLEPQKKGHIIFIGSMSNVSREAKSAVYVAAKAGVEGFAEAMRKDLSESGIKVTLIEPGKVKADFHPQSGQEQQQEVEEEKMLRAEDIAVAVHYVLTQPERCVVVSMQIRPMGQPI